MDNANLRGKRERIIEFLKKNPNATHLELKKNGLNHIERLFKRGLGEAYDLAKIKIPRTFRRKNVKERRQEIIDYIKKHPQIGGQNIVRDTKINISSAFKSIKEAFEAANVEYEADITLLAQLAVPKREPVNEVDLLNIEVHRRDVVGCVRFEYHTHQLCVLVCQLVG